MSNKTKKNKNIAILILTEFIRIRDVIAWTLISFIGFIFGISSLHFSNYLIPLLVFLVTTFFIMSFTFTINNYYDYESDKENPRRMQFYATSSGKNLKQTGFILNIAFIIIPLVISILYKFEVFIFCAFLLFLSWGYSAPPLRTKNIPIIDVLWHFLGFSSYIIWGSYIAGSIGQINWLVAFSIGVFSCIGQIWNHIIDYSFDKSSNTITFAVKFGLKKSKKILKIIIGLHIIFLIPLISLYTINYFETIISLIGLSLLGLIVIRPKKNAFPEKNSYQYFLAAGFGGAVYTSCMIYHLLLISGKPIVFEFLDFIRIF